VKFLKEYHIFPVAYCPLGRPTTDTSTNQGSEKLPDLRKDPKVQAIADRLGKSVFQVLLKWGIQRGYGVIPRSGDLKHQKENFDMFGEDFVLTQEEMAYLASKDERDMRICNKFSSFKGYDLFA
jgi:aldehyde reductase